MDRTGNDDHRLDIVLPALPRSVPQARHAVAGLLADCSGVPVLVSDDVVLLVSELVTNSVLHARTEITVSAKVQPGCVSVTVGDGDPLHRPILADRGLGATSGRGVKLVAALSTRWGVEVTAQAKFVWFELLYDAQGDAEHPVGAGCPSGSHH